MTGEDQERGAWEVQCIATYGPAGRALWRSGGYTPEQALAYLAKWLDDGDPVERVFLVRRSRSADFEAADGGIGPWRLVPVPPEL